MAFEKTETTEAVEIRADGSLDVRVLSVVKEDGVEIGRKRRIDNIPVDGDVSGYGPEVQKVAEGAWSADAKAARPGPGRAPSLHDIHTERDRRLAQGFDYDFGDSRGVHRIGTTPADLRGWDEVTKLAQARTNAGDSTPIDVMTDTGPIQVTPAEWNDVMLAAAAFRQPIWQASFVLSATSPIPADYASASYWP